MLGIKEAYIRGDGIIVPIESEHKEHLTYR